MAIYDCFPFFNEIELLKIRLNQYYNIVDKFVIVECAYTQQGNKKDFNFEKNKQEFSNYLDKIIYIKIEELPNSSKIINKLDWFIENFQRNAILQGLYNCTDDDLIIISDLDEFIKPDILKNLNKQKIIKINKENGFKQIIKQLLEILIKKRQLVHSSLFSDFIEYMPIVFQQEPHPFFMNVKENFNWYGSIICKYKNLTLPQQLRNKNLSIPYIKNGGYHFSYLGGKQAILKKLTSIIEGQTFIVPKKEMNIEQYVSYCLESGIDIWNPKNKFYMIDEKNIKLSDILKIKEKYPYFFKLP